jgi:hypothetical protein
MLRALCLAMTMLVFPLASARADAPADLGANAALKYWQAFATLPRFSDAEQKKLGAECLTMPLDDHAQELVNRAAYALWMLRLGAAQPRCDWGISWQELGVEVRLPQFDGARVLANLACLRARLRFAEGKNAEAIDDIVAGMTLGRHCGRDAIFISLLAGYAIEHRMTEALALDLPKLNAKEIKDLKKRLDGLPPVGNPATTIRQEERSFLDWFVRKVKETKDKDSLLALTQLFDQSPEKARAFLEECGGDVDGVLKMAEETRQSYRRMAKHLDLPLDQFEKEWDSEARKVAGNPVSRLIFPAVEKVRCAQARADIRRALLAAALAVQLDGRDALKNHPDPVVGGPFEYIAFAGGFELRSNWKVDEKLRAKWKLDERLAQPVGLTVGRRRK